MSHSEERDVDITSTVGHVAPHADKATGPCTHIPTPPCIACLAVGQLTRSDACDQAAAARDGPRFQRLFLEYALSFPKLRATPISVPAIDVTSSCFSGSVDDLKDIENLDRYIALTKAVLVFCSNGYFVSKNYMIELRASVRAGKLIIPLMDPDASKGGRTQAQVREQLIKAEASSLRKWGFDDDGPSAEELYTAPFENEPIEWNRIDALQDV